MRLPWIEIQFSLLVVVQHSDDEEQLYFFESISKAESSVKWKLLTETNDWLKIWPLAKGRQVAMLIISSSIVGKTVPPNFVLGSATVGDLVPSIKFEEFVWQKENRINTDSIIRFTRVENIDYLLKKCQDNRMIVGLVLLKGWKELDLGKLTSFDFSGYEFLVADSVDEVTQVKMDFINFRRIRNLILFGGLALFFLLLVNLGIRYYIDHRFQSINEVNEMIISIQDSLNSGQARLSEITNMVGNQDVRSIYASRYIDQLVTLRPNGMYFSKVEIFPVSVSEREEIELTRIDVGEIFVNGVVEKSEMLEFFIADVKKLKWIDRIRISKFESAMEIDGYNFILNIQVK